MIVMIIIIASFTIFCIAFSFFHLMNLRKISKMKHRKEWLDIYWFVGQKFGKTHVKIPRAFISLFDIFVNKKCGLTIPGVRIIIKNHENEYLVCKMEQKRCYENICYDVGSGGAVPSGCKFIETAKDELHEELGIDNIKKIDLREIEIWTPAINVHCLIFHYLVVLPKETKFVSLDNTYESFYWMSDEEIINYSSQIKDDPRNFILHLINDKS